MAYEMKIYLVGGAVRDEILGLPITERDWVVVGATRAEMLARGFKQVGKDFPVFLHPQTHEEYALARTERKTGKGYTHFAFYYDPSVTLEEDLSRRDLTINAMAKDDAGNLIDPYNGANDLRAKILHHVSPAFAEDPVRILRVARFAAKFGDFNVHPSTLTLMRQMLAAGEVDALVPERVWQELARALHETYPTRFFEVLDDCGILQKLFPEIAEHWPHASAALARAVQLSPRGEVRFASLLHDLTSEEVTKICKRYRAPNAYKTLALAVTKHASSFHAALELDAEKLLDLIEHLDSLRRPQLFADFLLACMANTNNANIATQQKVLLNRVLQLCQTVNVQALIAQGLQGEELHIAIHKARLEKIMTMF